MLIAFRENVVDNVERSLRVIFIISNFLNEIVVDENFAVKFSHNNWHDSLPNKLEKIYLSIEKVVVFVLSHTHEPVSQPLWLIRAMSFKIVHWNITIVSLLAFSFNRKLYNISSYSLQQYENLLDFITGKISYRGISQVRFVK